MSHSNQNYKLAATTTIFMVLVCTGASQLARANYLYTTPPPQTIDQQPPSITPFSFNQKVREGEKAMVMCATSSGESSVNYVWYKDGQLLTANLAQARRIIIKQDLDSSTLKINPVRLDHAGNYTCLAKNRVGSHTHSAQLVVHGEPRWVREPQHEPIVATRGQLVVIDCQTTGWPKPRQSWHIKTHTQGEFEPLTSANYGLNGRVVFAPNGSLIIRNADKSDEANYLCKSTNDIGNGISWSTSLKVTVPAHFDHSSKQLTYVVRRQNPVHIRCDAYGDQTITIEWYKNKQLLVNDILEPRYSIQSSNNPLKNGLISQLVIKQAQRHDNSLYECVTKNPYGKDRLVNELIVQEEPDNIQELQVTQINSRSVTLMWSEPYDGRSSITSYMFQYKKIQDSPASHLASPYSNTGGDVMDFIDSVQTLSDMPNTLLKSGSSATPVDGDWQHASRIMLPMASNTSVPGSVKSITIEKLEPSSKYILRALAINAIGQSKFSQPMDFSTDEEAPEIGPMNIRAAAINSTSIQVSWDEIPKSKQLGRIHGYYIGYRVATNNSAATNFVYKPYIINDLLSGNVQPSMSQPNQLQQQSHLIATNVQRLDTVIHDLRRDTVYEITVVAFNSRGSGPSSDFVVCKTIEMEAPKPVKLFIRRESNESIFVEWQRDPSDQNPVDDYVLYQEKNFASQELSQVRLPGNQTHYKAPNLKCGTRYQFYIIAQNKVGKSAPSEVVSASTSGTLPVIPSKTNLIKMVNSTCLLISLNSFQDNGCRIKTFTVRYRVEKTNLVASNGAAAGSPSLSPSSATIINSQGIAASHQALSASKSSLVQAAAVTSGSSSSLSSLASAASSSSPGPASEWINIRPRGNHYQRSSDDDRLEYLCDLSPVGEYTIHVSATNDVGRSEIEYVVLMSSDELRYSLLRDTMEWMSSLPNVFSYIPSMIVFLLAGLLLTLVGLILYTTAIKYYQKFVIMHNQIRASRRAKADEKRRRKLANNSSSRLSQKIDLWADEYDEDDDDDDDDDDGAIDIENQDNDGDIDEMDDVIESVSRAGSHSSGRSFEKHVGNGFHHRYSSNPANLIHSGQRNLNNQYYNPYHKGQFVNQMARNNSGHYMSNIANSGFDSSSIDSPCQMNKYGTESTCMSTASPDSIHNRFQCLNTKEYVKMNEYTMLPTISGCLSPPNDIYGAASKVKQQQQAPAAAGGSPQLIRHQPASTGSSTTAAASDGSSGSINGSMYYSTLRRTNMQTYLPQRQQSMNRNNMPASDIYGYYMAPQAQKQAAAAAAAAAAQQAANEEANSIFVPPQQIIYSAPNLRRQPPVFL